LRGPPALRRPEWRGVAPRAAKKLGIDRNAALLVGASREAELKSYGAISVQSSILADSTWIGSLRLFVALSPAGRARSEEGALCIDSTRKGSATAGCAKIERRRSASRAMVTCRLYGPRSGRHAGNRRWSVCPECGHPAWIGVGAGRIDRQQVGGGRDVGVVGGDKCPHARMGRDKCP